MIIKYFRSILSLIYAHVWKLAKLPSRDERESRGCVWPLICSAITCVAFHKRNKFSRWNCEWQRDAFISGWIVLRWLIFSLLHRGLYGVRKTCRRRKWIGLWSQSKRQAQICNAQAEKDSLFAESTGLALKPWHVYPCSSAQLKCNPVSHSF